MNYVRLNQIVSFFSRAALMAWDASGSGITMLSKASTNLSFFSHARNSFCCFRTNCTRIPRTSVNGKDFKGSVPNSLGDGRIEKLRQNCLRDRNLLFSVRMSGEPAMTGEAERGSARTSAVAKSSRVLVIGAGVAGLVAARELVREGLDVVIYEQSTEIGGVWVYNPNTESDPLGVDPHRSRVHSSMYFNLRTNLPREVMGFLDYPFLTKQGGDDRRFPGCQEVYSYIRDFAEHFNLLGLIEFGVEVGYVGIQGVKASVSSENINVKWIVRSKKSGEVNHDPEVREEIFDAVVICNGHYSEPKVIEIPGIESWPGLHMHSHNYRVPDPFQDKVVVIIGNGQSGGDISKELALVAKEVHICARNWLDHQVSVSMGGPRRNIWHHPLVERAYEDGSIKFLDGQTVRADVVMQCTGYFYTCPFLDTEGVVTVEDGRVAPLYKHVFVPNFAPSLAFVGLLNKIIPGQLFEAQSKWISKVLSGKVRLPSVSTMTSEVDRFYEGLEAKGIPRNSTLTVGIEQFEYVDWLLEQCGEKPVEPWRKGIYITTSMNRVNPDYRDDWKDQDLLNVAREYLEELAKKHCTVRSVN